MKLYDFEIYNAYLKQKTMRNLQLLTLNIQLIISLKSIPQAIINTKIQPCGFILMNFTHKIIKPSMLKTTVFYYRLL